VLPIGRRRREDVGRRIVREVRDRAVRRDAVDVAVARRRAAGGERDLRRREHGDDPGQHATTLARGCQECMIARRIGA
jgi:hypothetical protein